ncbi:hypothetical protein IW262DRAFT_1371295 [Armillaria fumosa]|nr:hypothetical protein IW262DRAFT_1371295 [Armillaria fumosa]
MILILVQWLTQLFSTIFDFIMPPVINSDDSDGDMCIFIREPAHAWGATSTMIFLKHLKCRTDFLLDGRRRIYVERVEYRKSRALWSRPRSPQYLVVTMKESLGAERRGYFLVDWPNDNLSLDGTRASSRNTKFNVLKRWDPPDTLNRIVVLRTIDEAPLVQNRCAYDIVMSMDLRRASRYVTFEDFLVLIQTASMNIPRNSTPYTICTVLAMETGAHIKRTRHLGKHSLPEQNEPEKVKSLWEAAKVVSNQEFEVALKVSLTDILPRNRINVFTRNFEDSSLRAVLKTHRIRNY